MSWWSSLFAGSAVAGALLVQSLVAATGPALGAVRIKGTGLVLAG